MMRHCWQKPTLDSGVPSFLLNLLSLFQSSVQGVGLHLHLSLCLPRQSVPHLASAHGLCRL